MLFDAWSCTVYRRACKVVTPSALLFYERDGGLPMAWRQARGPGRKRK
jgi:hypothetical protein